MAEVTQPVSHLTLYITADVFLVDSLNKNTLVSK